MISPYPLINLPAYPVEIVQLVILLRLLISATQLDIFCLQNKNSTAAAAITARIAKTSTALGKIAATMKQMELSLNNSQW